MHLGTCVTNPAVRDVTVTSSLFATLQDISGGRMELGIGRGDSSRRVMGKRPTTLAQLEETIRLFRELTAGREVSYDGAPVRMPWAQESPRVWVAGYGPKALELAGRVADGIILQFADPYLIRWCLGFVRTGAEAAGRDPKKIEVMSAAAVWVSSNLSKAREQVRWFPALVSNHVVDLISRYKPEELPPELTAYVRNRPGYDYLHHCEVASSNANFVTDEVIDRFAIVGTADAHRRRMEELRQAGVTQFNIYLMSGDEEATLDAYQHEIVPHFRA
jgi:probable F420-dependent oxidoreductase